MYPHFQLKFFRLDHPVPPDENERPGLETSQIEPELGFKVETIAAHGQICNGCRLTQGEQGYERKAVVGHTYVPVKMIDRHWFARFLTNGRKRNQGYAKGKQESVPELISG